MSAASCSCSTTSRPILNFLTQTTPGLAVDVFDFTLSAGVQFDWTNEPATDSQREDTRYLLKIGYEFEGDQNDWWQ